MDREEREKLMEAFDSFVNTFNDVDNLDFYPDQGAISAYAIETKTYLPLTGTLKEMFRETTTFRKEHPGMNSAERCSLIIDLWNENHPDDQVENPFT